MELISEIFFETTSCKDLLSNLEYDTTGFNIDREHFIKNPCFSDTGFVPLAFLFDPITKSINNTFSSTKKRYFAYDDSKVFLSTGVIQRHQKLNFTKFNEVFSKHAFQVSDFKYSSLGEESIIFVGPGIVLDSDYNILCIFVVEESCAFDAISGERFDITNGENIMVYLSCSLYSKKFEKLLKTLKQVYLDQLVVSNTKILIMPSEDIEKAVFTNRTNSVYTLLEESSEETIDTGYQEFQDFIKSCLM